MGNIIAFVRDNLTNMVSSLGTGRDKAAASVYSMPMLTDEELLNAYRGGGSPGRSSISRHSTASVPGGTGR